MSSPSLVIRFAALGESFLLTAQRRPQTVSHIGSLWLVDGFLFKWPLPPQAEEMYSLQNQN